MGRFILILSGLLFLILGCSTISFKNEKSPDYMKDIVQTQKFAEARSQIISNVEYKLSVDVSEPGEHFSGDQKISFDIKSHEDVYIDFQGGEILTAQVNRQVVKLKRGPIYVVVPGEILKVGRNEVQLVFRHEYSRSGAGLHKFSDPEDGKIYLYTDLEPHDASRWAPFFDQPDIKATLELSVKAPARWEVVSNAPVLKFDKLGKDSYWEFAKTSKISTYVFAMMAGPYHVWESQYKDIPLRIMVRDSLKKYVPYQDWFKTTQSGFSFFESYFDVAYPFVKYDQIIVPEFNSGAMENVGAVTFSERYLRRKDYTRFDMRILYATVLHEMAHIWFGNLVTNKWWSDLWLNESFATYMATLSLAKATHFKDSWVNFAISKESAYKLDESISTHQVAGDVKNSSQAFANFDSITYSKGAAVMKELSHYLGPDLFQEALRNYIKKHEYKNTTLSEFISAFNEASKLNLTPWFQSWLKTTGVDRVKQSYSCEPNKITLQIEVSAGGRPRTLKVAGYKKRWGVIQEVASTLIQTQGLNEVEAVSREVASNQKIDCPDFIYANSEDHGYLKIELDENSLRFIEENISLIKDDLLKVSIWTDLWSMVRDQKYKIEKFTDLAIKSLETENSQEILTLLTQKIVSVSDSVYYFTPNKTFSEKQKFKIIKDNFEAVIRGRMSRAVADRYKIFLEAYLASVSSEEGLKYVASLLEKSDNPDVRWKFLHALCREGYLRANELMEVELVADKSEVAYKNSLSCKASMPNRKTKEYYMSELLKDKISLSADEVDRIANGLYPRNQREDLDKISDKVFEAFRTKWLKLEPSFQKDLASGLVPVNCEIKSNEALSHFLDSNDELSPIIKRTLEYRYDEDKRCLAVREFNRTS